MKASIKIFLTQNQENNNYENPKLKFWQPIIEAFGDSYKKTDYGNADKCENYIRQKFASKLKENILRDLDNQLRAYEHNIIDGDYFRLFEDLRLFRKSERPDEQSEYIRALTTLIEKNGELRKSLYSENIEYQRLVSKRLIASQFAFAIKDVKYASLEFDLVLQPAQKVIDFCDNNFEYMQVFLGGFVAEIFREEFIFYDNSIQFDSSVFIDKTAYQNLTPSPITSNQNSNPGSQPKSDMSKLDKAKWYWTLANGSLLIPVLISIFLLYSYQSKLETIQSVSDKKVEGILQNQDKLIKQYQDASKRTEQIEIKLIDSFINKTKGGQ